MPLETLTYAALGARLTISAKAARSLVRRLRLPRSLSDDGKALVSVDLAELRHTPRPPGHREAGNVGLTAKIVALQAEIARQRSGRGRFQRTLQLVLLCVEAGNETIAQPLIDDVAAAIENHKLDDWEDRETVAAALSTVRKFSKKMQDNASESQKLFERICRLDPARALGAE